MSRLLHAAARGARIQSQWRDAHTPTYQEWQTNNQFVFIDTMRHYRIHPADEHLQYGPISTALRDVALTGDCGDYEIPYCRFVIEKEDIYSESTEDERSMFLLILAEALADEGM
jgi:hypothetical protein